MKQILKLTALYATLCTSKALAQGAGSAALWGSGNWSGQGYSATGGIRCGTGANTGAGSVAFGYESYAGGNVSFVHGDNSSAMGSYSTAFGYVSSAT